MKYVGKAPSFISTLGFKTSESTTNVIDFIVNASNSKLKSVGADESTNRASVLRDLLENSIKLNVPVLEIENKIFGVRDLILEEFPNLLEINNVLDILEGKTLEEFLKETLKNILNDMVRNIMPSQLEEGKKIKFKNLTGADTLEDFQLSIQNKGEINEILELLGDLDFFVLFNKIEIQYYSPRFKKYMNSLKELDYLYFFNPYIYRKIINEIDVLDNEINDYIDRINNEEIYSYEDFEKNYKQKIGIN